jgi:hypothetical protein
VPVLCLRAAPPERDRAGDGAWGGERAACCRSGRRCGATRVKLLATRGALSEAGPASSPATSRALCWLPLPSCLSQWVR